MSDHNATIDELTGNSEPDTTRPAEPVTATGGRGLCCTWTNCVALKSANDAEYCSIHRIPENRTLLRALEQKRSRRR